MLTLRAVQSDRLRNDPIRRPPKGRKVQFFKSPAKPKSGTTSSSSAAASTRSAGRGGSKEATSTTTTTATRTSLHEPADPLFYNCNGFSQGELKDFRESFYLIDAENRGTIAAHDLKELLLSLQETEGDSSRATTAYPHLRKLLTELESLPVDTMIDLDAYIEIMGRTSLHQIMQQEDGTNYAHVFQLFDLNGKGYIVIEDLERIAMELGECDITREELEEMISRAQTAHQGRVYLHDFARIMNLNLFQEAEPTIA